MRGEILIEIKSEQWVPLWVCWQLRNRTAKNLNVKWTSRRPNLKFLMFIWSRCRVRFLYFSTLSHSSSLKTFLKFFFFASPCSSSLLLFHVLFLPTFPVVVVLSTLSIEQISRPEEKLNKLEGELLWRRSFPKSIFKISQMRHFHPFHSPSRLVELPEPFHLIVSIYFFGIIFACLSLEWEWIFHLLYKS